MVILDCWKQSIFTNNNQKTLVGPVTESEQHYPSLRPPSPNCHCSCHRQKLWFRRNPSTTASDRTHTKFPVLRPNGTFSQYLTDYSPQKALSPTKLGCEVDKLQYCLQISSKPSRSSSRDSNYCEIYELVNNKSHRTASLTTISDHPLYSTKFKVPKNILFIARVNPFKFSIMEPLNVNNRLIVFSLIDTFTKLSPNKIFENFIQKLKEENKFHITVFNLSEPLEYMRESLDVPICEFGWPEKHAPSLEKLCSLCKAIDSWLALDSLKNVAIIYSKRDLSRASLAIAVFLQYVNICVGDDSMFDYETMQHYYQHNLHQYLHPSQKRYVEYFKALLSGSAKINNQQFFLKQVIIRKIPNFEGNGVCKPFIKIYQGMNLVYSSSIINVDANYLEDYDFIVFSLNPPLKLRGEILIKCYHKIVSPSSRTVMFSLQFHTGTLSNNVITFSKDDIDIAAYDKRFHMDTRIELIFNEAQCDILPKMFLLEDDLITSWNSYENFFTADNCLEYTKGPLDGSLYATVSKRTMSNSTTNNILRNENELDELLKEIFLEIKSFPDIKMSPVSNHSDNNEYQHEDSIMLVNQDFTSEYLFPDKSLSPVKEDKSSLIINENSVFHNLTRSEDSQLTWLQKQQLKLKNKQNKSLQKRNIMEQRLIEELKHTIKNNLTESVSRHNDSMNAPDIPVRTSSRYIIPLYGDKQTEQSLSSPQQELISSTYECVQLASSTTSDNRSIERPDYLELNQVNYDEIDTCEPNNSNYMENLELNKTPTHLHRSITPSFPVNNARSSLLCSPTKDDNYSTVPMFIKDTSSFWYKPNISRQDAVKLLQDKPPGTFIIRNSNSFQGAYGLVLKVSSDEHKPISGDLVRHFLIESTSKGVQFKGCAEEPVFSSLAALVYQHSITKISLPITLIIPTTDIETDEDSSYLTNFYENGAACNVLYLTCDNVESLTGPLAIKRVVDNLINKSNRLKPTMVHFKASNKGITLTDNSHRIFFRQHYPLESVSFCCLDSENRYWCYDFEGKQLESALFGFVSRKKGSIMENECIIFCQFEPDQPSHAIVDFVNKLMAL